MSFLEKGFVKPSERILRLKDEIFSAKPVIEVDRARLITESFKETEKEPILIRKAKALKNILENFDFLQLKSITTFINHMINSEQIKRTNHQKFSEENLDLMIDAFKSNKYR